VATSGGIGGFFGLLAMSIELPISTTIILRSIADIARSEKENINSDETKIACIEVFALGGPTSSDGASESGYFTVRAALAQSVTKAAEYLAEKGLSEEAAPALVRLIIRIAERFSIQVTEKAAAQAIPAIGAAGGAIINTIAHLTFAAERKKPRYRYCHPDRQHILIVPFLVGKIPPVSG
jgi:hypothetical protein